ncbi:MAG: hypothetical protein P4L83_05955 [Nevskia sp.]|nr:hypothetical protein [Nevskia sp.]
MKIRQALETGAFLLLSALLAYCWLALAPPVPLAEYAYNPAYFALAAGTLTSALYLALRLAPARTEGLERLLLALFLAAMPLIYLWAALRSGDRAGALIEAGGFCVYGALAFVGYRRSVALLGLGIIAHGVGWDAWHHHHAAYIEPWYPFGCFVVDAGLGLLVLVRHAGLRPLAPRPGAGV